MPSLWKKWLSHLFEFHVESAPSEHNPHLYVSLNRGRYQLSTANAIYSHEDLYTNYLQAFQRLPLDELPIEEVLVLGLGLGSVPFMLERHFGKRYYYTAVEIDENVIDLAHRYCLNQLDSPITAICADAYAYMLQNEQTYDLICMDIFLDDVVPPLFESLEFLEALRDSLSPQGLLLYNRLARTPEDREQSRVFFEGPFREIFPEAACLDVSYNWMLLNRGAG
jgi:spermidine synthase